MLTIDRLAKIDKIADSILAALYRGVDWIDAQYEARWVNAAYRVAEAKAAAIGKAAAKISDLEDDRAELIAHGGEAKVLLQEQYKATLAALDKKLAAKADKISADLAAAAQAWVAANKEYEATVRAAKYKLGVEVEV